MATLRLLLVASLAILAQACGLDAGNGLSGLDVTAADAPARDDADVAIEPTDLTFDGPPSEPHLVVTPASIEFEWVLLGEASVRTLRLANQGSLTLTLQPPALAFATTPFVELVGAPTDLFSVAPGHHHDLVVRFAPTALFPPRNEPIAFVRLTSNDPDTPQLDVPVFGRTTEATSPDLRVEPASLDLGTVPFGGTGYGKVTLWNQGDRELVIQSVTFEEAIPVFTIVADPSFPPTQPWPEPFALQPGDHQAVHVRLDTTSRFASPGELAATLVIASDDPHVPKKGVPVTALVALSDPCQLVLTTPSPVEFGATTTGCFASPRAVRLENAGTEPMRIDEVLLKEACAPLFPYYLPAPLPVDVPAGGSWTFEVGFAPLVEGLATCLLTVRAKECADQFLGLAGTGSTLSTSVETFLQRPAPRLDVLLVVQATASMQPVLDRLADDVPTLFEALAASQVDAHVGLIAESCHPDCPVASNLLTTPRILTVDDAAVLAEAVAGLASLDCPAAPHEAGLDALMLALSHPRITDFGIPCAPVTACPGTAPCTDGGCGGANRLFLRPDAQLRVLMVSDDDDASYSEVADYVAFAESLAIGMTTDVAVTALVGDLPQGCQGFGVSAGAAPRYGQFAGETGGATATLCAPDYRGTLSALGTVLAPFQTVFVLAAAPVPGSLQVSLDGVPCNEGWWVDPLASALVFEPQGPCTPPPESTITVQYERLCSGG